MNLQYFLSTLCLLCFTPFLCPAQKNFVEGEVSYVISSRSSATAPLEPTGTFTLTFKTGMIRKDIRMRNGYTNSIIINGGNNSIHSLRTLTDVHYAVQMDYAEYLEKQRLYEGFSLNDQGSPSKIADYTARMATVTYKDGTSTTIYYTPDLLINQPRLFERFPGIKYLPLVFDFSKEGGPVLHLELQKVEAKPVETSLFNIPQDYKIISSKELKELNK